MYTGKINLVKSYNFVLFLLVYYTTYIVLPKVEDITSIGYNLYMISMIAAIGKERELGKTGSLLWHLPKDFDYFKTKTLNKVIIMGRKTFESIGKPLPRRKSIVITSQSEWNYDGVICANSLENALELARDFTENNPDFDKELFIIGGGDIYRQALDHADTIYLTEVDGAFPYADTFFPVFDKNIFREISREHISKDQNNEFDFDFVIYKK